MLKGFEQQTKELTKAELSQARSVYRIMVRAFNQGRTITNKQISKRLEAETGEKVSGSRIRKMINWMHTNRHLKRLIASNKGYQQARNKQELLDYRDSLTGRVNAITERIDAVQVDISEYDEVANITATERQQGLFDAKECTV